MTEAPETARIATRPPLADQLYDGMKSVLGGRGVIHASGEVFRGERRVGQVDSVLANIALRCDDMFKTVPSGSIKGLVEVAFRLGVESATNKNAQEEDNDV